MIGHCSYKHIFFCYCRKTSLFVGLLFEVALYSFHARTDKGKRLMHLVNLNRICKQIFGVIITLDDFSNMQGMS